MVLEKGEKAVLVFTLILLSIGRAIGLNDLVRNVSGSVSSGPGHENASGETGEESEFPEDLFTEEQRKRGAIVLHVILALYCFAAIATVCTEHFLPTIRCICQDLKISDDVAAATFMSTATSSPELFTNIIGTFITQSDIGVGHVLGNAYYDMFFVAALGGLAAKQDVLLDWWPITRDCFIYLVVASTLSGIVWDGVVTTGETLVLLTLYGLYFIIMFYNRRIIGFCRETFGFDMNDPVDDDLKSFPARNNLDAQEALNPSEPPVVSQNPSKEENKFWGIARKAALRPLLILIGLTIPDVRKEKLRKYYPLTFVLCVAWIGMSTYFGTWMISTIGETIGIPDSVMGMVFMAAGGSVVEAYAVFYKVRRGECSIGLSNSMGCNTLDITVCMALPWFVRCVIPAAGASAPTNVVIRSPGIQFNCFLLVACVIVLFAVLSANKFKLNKALGAVCGVVYVTILGIAILKETH